MTLANSTAAADCPPPRAIQFTIALDPRVSATFDAMLREDGLRERSAGFAKLVTEKAERRRFRPAKPILACHIVPFGPMNLWLYPNGTYALEPRRSHAKRARKPRDEVRTAKESKLTQREEVVLGLMCEDLSSREIAKRLRISADTAQNYIQSILSKAGAGTRREAINTLQDRAIAALEAAR